MCPMRFILVFFSAILAGYFAWRTVRSSPDANILVSDCSTEETLPSKEEHRIYLKKAILNGFWVFVDMASGKYLWRNLRELKREVDDKSC